jgi:hypothetical protein
MVDSPLEVVQKVCSFLGVQPPEQAPLQPFTQQSCGDPCAAFDAASWDELYNAFKHTERAADFEPSRFISAPTRAPEADLAAYTTARNKQSADIPTIPASPAFNYDIEDALVRGRENLVLSGSRPTINDSFARDVALPIQMRILNVHDKGKRPRRRAPVPAALSQTPNLLRI